MVAKMTILITSRIHLKIGILESDEKSHKDVSNIIILVLNHYLSIITIE